MLKVFNVFKMLIPSAEFSVSVSVINWSEKRAVKRIGAVNSD